MRIPSSPAAVRELKLIEKLYIGAGLFSGSLSLLAAAGLLFSVPLQARTFMVDQALMALFVMAAGGFLLHSCVSKLRLARARASIERDPLGFVEAHGYGRSLRTDGEFESLTARMSMLCGLHSVVSARFAQTLSSYLKIHQAYEPNSQRWKESVRGFDKQVRKKLARKLANNDGPVRGFVDEGGSEADVSEEDLPKEGSNAEAQDRAAHAKGEPGAS